MRGLTKEEAARLPKYFSFVPSEWTPNPGEAKVRIHEQLVERGALRQAFDGTYFYWEATPLGKLALRVHQLCVERGLA